MRAALFVMLVTAAVVATEGTASASGAGEAGGSSNGQGGQVVVLVPGADGGGHASGGFTGGAGPQARIVCRVFSVTFAVGSVLPAYGPVVSDTSTLTAGTTVWFTCRDMTTGADTFETLLTWNPANPPVLAPSAAQLAQMAANGMRVPLPVVRTWPASGGKGLVNLPVWLHVENWTTVSASASAAGLTATVEAMPVRARWDMTDDTVTCTDAGSRYDGSARPDPLSSSCSYTYRHSSGSRPDHAFQDSATVVWRLRWHATNGQGGDLGEVTGPVAGFVLQIEESQALVAPNQG